MSSSSNSGSGSSGSSEEDKPCVTLENSETSSEAEVASAKARARAGMFTWPCPRHFHAELSERQSARVLKPADVSREDFLETFKTVLRRKGYLHNLVKAAVADEPHKHYQADGNARERHKHLIFLFRQPFVHASVCKMLGEQFGAHGFFTFHRAGWVAYLDYLMSESAKKPAQDLDRQMVFYPAAYTWQRAEAELGQMSLQMSGRRQNDGVQQRKEPEPKRRKQMTFSELTDFVVERGIRAVGALWQAGLAAPKCLYHGFWILCIMQGLLSAIKAA